MAKVRTVFICQACGFESSKWLGRCPDCGEWNSLVEERQEVAAPPGRGRPAQMALPGGGSRPVAFDDVDAGEADRVPSGIGEFDRVLGGGIVPDADVPALEASGIAKIFGPGTSLESIQEWVAEMFPTDSITDQQAFVPEEGT